MKLSAGLCPSVLLCPEIPCRVDNRHLLEEHFKKCRFNASEHFEGGRKQPKCHDQNAQGSMYGSGEED